MGIESRDWYREESRKASRRGMSRASIVVLVVVVVGFAVAVSPTARDRLGYEPPLGMDSMFRGEGSSGLQMQVVPGGPTFTLNEQPIYGSDDPWKAWLADEQQCPGGENRSAPQSVQVQVQLCLVNFARERQGLPPLRLSRLLSASSAAKASDIVACDDFAHEACGRPADQAVRALGYRGSFGENLYVAEGKLVTPRVAVDRWLNSPGHRENLFRPEWRTIGIARVSDSEVEDVDDGVLWVNQFGD
jgi:uncharacterized protein YkwD